MQSFTGLFRDTSLSESFERVFSCQKVVLVACRRWLRDLELRVVESLPPSSHAHQTQEAPCPGLAGGGGAWRSPGCPEASKGVQDTAGVSVPFSGLPLWSRVAVSGRREGKSYGA